MLILNQGENTGVHCFNYMVDVSAVLRPTLKVWKRYTILLHKVGEIDSNWQELTFPHESLPVTQCFLSQQRQVFSHQPFSALCVNRARLKSRPACWLTALWDLVVLASLLSPRSLWLLLASFVLPLSCWHYPTVTHSLHHSICSLSVNLASPQHDTILAVRFFFFFFW